MEEYIFELDGKEYHFPKDIGDKDKYVVFACAKHEDDYIVEWVNHYLTLGFDKVFIADNNDNPEILRNLLIKYTQDGKVQIFECNDVNILQIPIYTQFCREGNYKWCAYFDCDEFLEIPGFWDFNDFICSIEDNVDCICMNWVMYGFDNQIWKAEGSVQERFTKPLTPMLYQKENMFIKSIVRGDHPNKEESYFISAHCVKNDIRNLTYSLGGYHLQNDIFENTFPSRYKKGYLKHYYTKSLEEWFKKANRGWADGTVSLNTLSPSFYLKDNVFNIENYFIGPFIRGFGDDNELKQLTEEYDIIQINHSTNNCYSLLLHIMKLYYHNTGNVYIFTENSIDDTLFVLLTEYALLTGNKAIFLMENNKMWDMYLKYSKGKNNTYYILDCL